MGVPAHAVRSLGDLAALSKGPNHGEENGQEAQDSRRPPVDDSDIPF
jgi:hypothetical protein